MIILCLHPYLHIIFRDSRSDFCMYIWNRNPGYIITEQTSWIMEKDGVEIRKVPISSPRIVTSGVIGIVVMVVDTSKKRDYQGVIFIARS